MSISTAPEQLPSPGMELNLKDYLDVVRRRKAVFFQTFALVLAVGIVITTLSKPVYRTAARITVPIPQNNVNVVDAQQALAPVLVGIQPDPMSTQLQVLQSGEFLKEARAKAGLKPEPGVIPPTVQFSAVEGTQNVISIAVEGGSPAAIQKFAQAIVDLHIERMKSGTESNLDKALNFVDGKVKDAKRALSEKETALIQFRRTHNVVKLNTEAESVIRQGIDLDARVRETEANILSTQAKLAELRARLAREPLDLVEETYRDNPRKPMLRTRLDELKFRRTDLLKEYKETSREVLDLDRQIAEAQAEYDAEPVQNAVKLHSPNPQRAPLQTRITDLETTLLGQVQDLNAARGQLRAVKNSVDDVGPWEVQLARLTRERDAAQTTLDGFQTKLQDLEIRSEIRLENGGIRIIQPPGLPGTPVRPRRDVNIMLSALLALFLAAGMAFLQEYLDDRVNSPDDVERLTALPTLGHVPMIDGEQARLLHSMAANSHVAEAYRGLRSGIGFAALDAPIRRLQVTSASKGEGKSTTAVNLATALAMDGKRVILVDGDLRRPNLHRILEIPSSPGLSEVLVGMRSLEESLQDTEVENLRVLCAGPIPPNPAELLGSAAFDRVIAQLEEMADIVVYDTPPCMPVTDPLIIASRMDGVVVVLHVGQTRKGAVKHVIQQLNRARARVIGVVFNRVQPRKGGYYYYNYYYSGDGYYADTAQRGERHRRNGKKRLSSGKDLVAASRSADDDEA